MRIVLVAIGLLLVGAVIGYAIQGQLMQPRITELEKRLAEQSRRADDLAAALASAEEQLRFGMIGGPPQIVPPPMQ